jgi:hypothetical protein
MSRYLKEIDGEVAQNDVYAGILKKSLDYGPELLLHLHDSISEKEISDQPEIVAIQEKVDNSSDEKELDWVIDGGDRWVGFESKKTDDLKLDDQLVPEMEDLQTYSEKDPILVAITDDIKEPAEKIEKAESGIEGSGEIRWESWHSVAKTVYETESGALPKEQRPFVDILQDMFESEGYPRKFDGIEATGATHKMIKQREKNLIALTNSVIVNLEEPYWNDPHPVSYTYNGRVRTTNKSRKRKKIKKSYRHASPQHISFQYICSECDTKPDKQSSVSVLANLHQDEIYTVLDVNINRESDELDVESLMERSDELKDVCESRDLSLWISTNSWDVEGYPQKRDPEDIEELTDQARKGNQVSKHKRLIFGHRLEYQDFDSPEEFIGEIVDNLREVTEVFLIDNSFFNEAFPHVE